METRSGRWSSTMKNKSVKKERPKEESVEKYRLILNQVMSVEGLYGYIKICLYSMDLLNKLIRNILFDFHNNLVSVDKLIKFL